MKIISERLLPRDHKIFSGGLETFSTRRSKKSTKTSPTDTDGATPEVSKSKELDEERR